MSGLPVIAITMGDAAGVSPEIIVKSLCQRDVYEVCRPLVIGDARIMRKALKFTDPSFEINTVNDIHNAKYQYGIIDVYDLNNLAPDGFKIGKTNESCGKAFVEYIRLAAKMALEGTIDAVASAPTNKEAMQAAGHIYPGQTEIFAEETGITDFFTVLAGGRLRVFLISSHVSLRKAIEMVTQERVEKVIRKAREVLKELWGIENPRIAVAGLNPHAGDGGLFGQEEIEEVIPVMERLKNENFDLVGPVSSDSLYYAAEQGSYDGVVGMYHDQGVIPLKRYGYVTVIAGIPIIRTTAGHGTAYDIAWKGVARSDVMKRAILLAAELAALKKQRTV